MRLRKLVSIVLITAMLFFAPSMIPARDVPGPIPCGIPSGWLPTDTAFAGPGIVIPCPVAPTSHAITGWFWGLFACPASIILSGIVANFRDNRQLTAPEAWSCGLLFWFAKPKTAPASNHP